MRANGRGLQPSGVRVKDVADFKIYTEGAGEGQPDVQVIGPGGTKMPCKLQKVCFPTTINPKQYCILILG